MKAGSLPAFSPATRDFAVLVAIVMGATKFVAENRRWLRHLLRIGVGHDREIFEFIA
jgi:hypothetical protein